MCISNQLPSKVDAAGPGIARLPCVRSSEQSRHIRELQVSTRMREHKGGGEMLKMGET